MAELRLYWVVQMPRVIYRHESTDRFVVGTVGQPGARTFYLQAESKSGLNTVMLDKGQVIGLVDRLLEMIKELRRNNSIPKQQPVNLKIDNKPLTSPFDEDFQVGLMSVTFENQMFVLRIQEIMPGDQLLIADDVISDEDGPDLCIVKLDLNQIYSFIERAKKVVAAGRPDCMFCSLPIDPEGHLCPRANGYRR